MALRSVGADRLPLALSLAQPADELGAEQQTDEQGRRARRTGAEADVADEVEGAGEAEMLGDYVEHASSFAMLSTSFARPTEFDALTRTASPGRTIRRNASIASSTLETRSSEMLPITFSASGRISSPIRMSSSTCAARTAGARPAWSSALCSPSSRIGPRTAIRRLASLSAPRLLSVAAIDAGFAL